MGTLQTFVNGSYVSQNPIQDQEELMNLYVEVSESAGASSPAGLLRIPGAGPFATTTATGNRGGYTHDQTGRSFAMQGGSLTEILSTGGEVVRGAVAVDGNPATFSTNGDQLLITSGGNAYCFVLASNTLTLEVTGEATQGAVLYGYGLIFDKVTGIVRLSDINDLTTWDPTQFFARSINTDPWQAMHVTPYGYIVLPGTQTGEGWYNAGTSPIPFAPDPSANFARGIAATFSIQQVAEAVVWLSRGVEGDYTVVRMPGFTPSRISNHAVEYSISTFNDAVGVEDAIGQVYGEHGHLFYLLTFPSSNLTWVFDAITVGKANPWAKRGTWIKESGSYVYWRSVFHWFAFGMHLTGDPNTNVISELDHDYSTDVEDRPIRWMRRSPAVLNEHTRLSVSKLELLMQTGVGTATGQGTNPSIVLRVSRDGGRTWGNEHPCRIGAQGEYWRRAIWRMLGRARSFAFEFVGSDPVSYRISALFITTQGSTEARAA